MDYLYIFILFLCAIASVINKNAQREKLWIYFLVVLISEVYTIFFQKKFNAEIYLYSGLIYNSYLIYYFLKETNYWRYIFIIFIFISIIVILDSKLYSHLDSISIILLYLFLSLRYYFSQIISVDEIPLQEKQKFWISTGIFIWSIAYAFNALPIYFLSSNDMNFMILINTIFCYVTIVTYIIFLIGLFCKNK